jgi:hypothetical protein
MKPKSLISLDEYKDEYMVNYREKTIIELCQAITFLREANDLPILRKNEEITKLERINYDNKVNIQKLTQDNEISKQIIEDRENIIEEQQDIIKQLLEQLEIKNKETLFEKIFSK